MRQETPPGMPRRCCETLALTVEPMRRNRDDRERQDRKLALKFRAWAVLVAIALAALLADRWLASS